DEMLDMGFADELDAILESVPATRQSALFSATLAPRIRSIAKRHLTDPVHVTIANEATAPGEMPRVREVAYVVPRPHKIAALARVLDVEDPTSVIVFCRTRTEVDELTETLGGRGYQAEAIHGGLSQEQRDRVLRRFREGKSELLIATDVAARGLDIDHVSHVVNYDVPSSPDAYVHRIGRTGRAGREGVAITLAEAREQRLLRNIEQHTKRKITIEAVPTVHDLRARRLEILSANLITALEEGELDRYRIVAQSLATEHEPIELAAAALKLVDRGRDGDQPDEEEIPAAESFGSAKKNPRKPPRPRSDNAPMTRIFISLGRNDNVRPADLVGAIANEAQIDSRELGAIDIADRFSLVEVPERLAEGIIKALKRTTIRGKRVSARPDRGR
ncbi:MAG TPA: DEAD/DEAH box helicase, partial [Candidatus Dormibacteraeota bacterium]|nr:DEAD/DEAH box helicase [Candidatus Dormibacteraeota bacterium]